MRVQIQGDSYIVKDDELGVDAIYEHGNLSGKGSRKYKDDILTEVDNYKRAKDMVDEELGIDDDVVALASIVGLGVPSTDSYTNDDIENLYNWQRMPIKYNQKLRQMSSYFYNQKGILSEAYDLFASLSNLNSYIDEDVYDYEGYEDDRKIVDNFNKKFDNVEIRQGLLQIAQYGTLITYRRGGKKNPYLQYLDLDYYYPARIKNGLWEVECDLTQFYDGTGQTKTFNNRPINFNNLNPETLTPKQELNDQPLEVQRAAKKWLDGLAGKDNMFPHIHKLNINRTYVIKNKARQQQRYGVPYGIAAFEDMIHKDLLKLAERAVVDQVINQLVYMRMGEEGKDGYHPTEKQAKKVFNNLKNAMNASNKGGIKMVGIPYWATIESLKVDYGIFDKKKYEQIDKDILINLGIPGLISTGGGSSFSQGKINLETFFSKIYSVLEQFERMFEHYYSTLVSNKEAGFTRKFPRLFEVDSGIKFDSLKDAMSIGGSVKSIFDMVGVDYNKYVSQVEREQKVDDLQNLLKPYPTSYTMSPDSENGRPQGDNPEENKDGNDQPRPSTEEKGGE